MTLHKYSIESAFPLDFLTEILISLFPQNGIYPLIFSFNEI